MLVFFIVVSRTQKKSKKLAGNSSAGSPSKDSLFVLKTLLTVRKNHNLPSHVASVNLVKAYDTANHALMFDILERYGAPPRFVSAIKHIYQDLVVVLKIEKEVVELPQTVGVRQGNNKAPVLFLFLMSVFAETLKTEWQREGIDVCTVRSFVGPSLTSGKGKLRGHLPKEYLSRELTAVKILQCLYANDEAFIFKSREDMTQGLALLYQHFGKLGLEMHIGRGTTASKTKCVFIPPQASLILAYLLCLPQVMTRRQSTSSNILMMHLPATNDKRAKRNARDANVKRSC